MNADPIDFVSARERRLLRGYQADGYVELRPLLRDLGIEIEEKILADGISGEAFFVPGKSPSGFVIVVNKREPIERRRFTAAHEIAHCLLHGEFIRKKGVNELLDMVPRSFYEEDGFLIDSQYDPFADDAEVNRERQADEFAAALLMPAWRIRQLWRSGTWRYDDLARALGVSRSAVARRIAELRKPFDAAECRVH